VTRRRLLLGFAACEGLLVGLSLWQAWLDHRVTARLP